MMSQMVGGHIPRFFFQHRLNIYELYQHLRPKGAPLKVVLIIYTNLALKIDDLSIIPKFLRSIQI